MVVTWSWWSLWSHRSVVRCSLCLVVGGRADRLSSRGLWSRRSLANIAIVAVAVAAVVGPLASAEVVAAVVSEVAVGGRWSSARASVLRQLVLLLHTLQQLVSLRPCYERPSN